MSEQFSAEVESQTARQLARIMVMVDQSPHRAAELGFTDPHFQDLLARSFAENETLLKVARERGIIEPEDVMLPWPVITARLNAERDSFTAALRAMDRMKHAG